MPDRLEKKSSVSKEPLPSESKLFRRSFTASRFTVSQSYSFMLYNRDGRKEGREREMEEEGGGRGRGGKEGVSVKHMP